MLLLLLLLLLFLLLLFISSFSLSSLTKGIVLHFEKNPH